MDGMLAAIPGCSRDFPSGPFGELALMLFMAVACILVKHRRGAGKQGDLKVQSKNKQYE